VRQLYLIGAFVIAGLLFFITKDNLGGEDSRSFTNAVRPTALQIAGFALGDDEPFLAVNLLTFKNKAEYADGRETNLSGKEAYAIYADEVIDHLAKVGAEPILAGDVQRLILGEVDELWDVIAIVRYPSRKAMYKMATNKEYMESEKHREAGLAGQLNIEIKDSNQFNF
tara:strand:- start:10148 stop:10654 length:507 start_codon:yes stop_codon:yes gene_type:complete